MKLKKLFIFFILLLSTSLFAQEKEELEWYKDVDYIEAYSADEFPSKVGLEVYFGYEPGDESCLYELKRKKNEIKDYLIQFINSKTRSELMKSDNKQNLIDEIKKEVNENILIKSKIKDVDIYAMMFFASDPEDVKKYLKNRKNEL